MKTIWKYEFAHNALEMDLMIPIGAEILDVQIQGYSICAWFIVDTTKKMVQRKLRIYVTGDSLPDNRGKYVATVQMNEYVHHIFDIGEKELNRP